MQQHYPAGHMFLSTRWRKSNSRWAQMSHFFFLKSSVFHTVNYKTLNICRQLAASQSEVSGSKRSCASQHSDAHTAIRLIDLSQHFERLRVERVEEWGGGGDSPECPPLSDFLTPFPLPFLSRPGVAPRRAREWERTGKKTQWNNIAALPHTSCLPSPCHFLFEVCSSVDQSDSGPGVPVSFTGG